MGMFLFIGIALISFLVHSVLKTKFETYSKVPSSVHMTGADVSRKMLHDNGIYDLQVVPHDGNSSYHYTSEPNTLSLRQ